MFSARGGFMYTEATASTPGDVVVGSTVTPFMNAYAWTDASGFGTKYANPGTISLSLANNKLVFNSSNSVLLSTASATPFVQAYRYTVGTGFGTKYSNPATAGTSGTTYIQWNPGTYTEFVTVFTTTPFIEAYKWTDASGFGTKYSPPGTLPATSQQCRFSTTGAAVGVATNAAANYNMYAFTSASGFGTRYSDPATQSAQTGRGLVFSSNNNWVQYCGSGGGINTTAWNDGTGFGSFLSGNSISTLTIPANNAGFEIANYNATTGISWNLMLNQTSGGGATGQIYATPYNNSGTLASTAKITTLPIGPSNTKLSIRHSSGLPVAVAVCNSTTAPFITAYAFNAGASAATNPIGTQYANPGTAISGGSISAAFTN